jgi:ABC-type branched-subunit amino acid transport system ATPase component
MTVIENLLVASRDQKKARDLLTLVGLSHLEREYSVNLSYGQQKLLEFVRVLMMDPALIFLDEPTAGIDPILTDGLLKWFKMLRGQGKTLIIVEHNMDVINAICERIVVLHHGRRIAEGTPLEIQQDRLVQDAYLGGA